MRLFTRAAPFWVSLVTILLVVFGAVTGGLWVLVPFVLNFHLSTFVDRYLGTTTEALPPDTPRGDLFFFDLILRVWPVLQTALFVWFFWYVPQAEHLSLTAKLLLAMSLAGCIGIIGINYSHELMHRRRTIDTWRADILLGQVFYGAFRTEHIFGHHINVGTPKDPATARYNEGFWAFLPRTVSGTWASAFDIERTRLAKRGLAWWHPSNAMWRYWALGLFFVALTGVLGGLLGIGLWLCAMAFSILSLELTNYIEHYGLERRPLPNGKYEPTRPHHSWNCDHKFSNWLLINLQRHSDHHYKPERPFAVLQTYSEDEAPILPYSYTTLGMIAMVPRRWRKLMNPRVRAWRKRFYPDVTDWDHPAQSGSSA